MKKINKNDEGLVSAMCHAIIEDAQNILTKVESLDSSSLPVWWTSKLSVSSAYLNSLRDYITYNTDELVESEEEDEEEENTESDLVDIPVEVEEPEEDESMFPPSVRLMKNATKAG